MTQPVILRDRAQKDLRSAFQWYDSLRPGLGAQFLAAVQQRLENIAEFPEAHPVIYRRIRRAGRRASSWLVEFGLRPRIAETRLTCSAQLPP